MHPRLHTVLLVRLPGLLPSRRRVSAPVARVDNRLFSDINVELGCVAIYARHGVIFSNHFTANLPATFAV